MKKRGRKHSKRAFCIIMLANDYKNIERVSIKRNKSDIFSEIEKELINIPARIEENADENPILGHDLANISNEGQHDANDPSIENNFENDYEIDICLSPAEIFIENEAQISSNAEWYQELCDS